jgi:hypothetical protein
MKIALLEICIPTHYSAINGLIKTYSVEPNNSIVLYTTESIAKAIRENGKPDSTELVIMSDNERISDFLKKIEKIHFDRIHVCSIESHFKEFAEFKPNVDEYFYHVHDVDIWFEDNFKTGVKNWIYSIQNKPQKIRETAKFVRDIFVRKGQRRAILSFIKSKKHQYIVHSKGQRDFLSQFVESKKITVFPFAINEGIEKNVVSKKKNAKIRICIPGIVTDSRRDYTGLFSILDKILPQIKDSLSFDFLGFVEKSEPHLLQKMHQFEQQGLEIYYYTDFVFGQKFDNALDKSDLLLNNQKVTTSHTTKYGVTKESGMLFNMIRAVKPGILPKAYAVDADFEDSIIYYDSENQLTEILLNLANGSIQLEKYTDAAYSLAQKYTPQSLYSRLINQETIATN